MRCFAAIAVFSRTPDFATVVLTERKKTTGYRESGCFCYGDVLRRPATTAEKEVIEVMPTSCLTIVKDERDTEICVILRTSNGQPTAHGFDLKRFLSCFTITSGVAAESLLERKRKFARGMNCLAAQIIAHFKSGIGSFYLHPAGTRYIEECYRYTVYLDEEGIKLEVEAYSDGWHLLFQGLVEWFDADHAEETWREQLNPSATKQSLPEPRDAIEVALDPNEENDDWWETAIKAGDFSNQENR
jgi:hypothetical protein